MKAALVAALLAFAALVDALVPLLKELVNDRVEARKAAPHARLVDALAAGDADAVAAAYDELDVLLSAAGIAPDSLGGVGDKPEPRRELAGVVGLAGPQRHPHPSAVDQMP